MTLQQDFLSQKLTETKIKVIKDIEEAVDYLDNDRKEKIYVITCFSDKGKFLEKVKVD